MHIVYLLQSQHENTLILHAVFRFVQHKNVLPPMAVSITVYTYYIFRSSTTVVI
jgi:hypothetical protein